MVRVELLPSTQSFVRAVTPSLYRGYIMTHNYIIYFVKVILKLYVVTETKRWTYYMKSMYFP